MNISNSNISASRSEAPRNGQVNGAGRVSGHEVSVNRVELAQPLPGDRFEISNAARAAAGDQKARELTLAKKALEGLPPASAERLNEIQERINNGYYNNPDVLRTIAAKMTNDLSGSGF